VNKNDFFLEQHKVQHYHCSAPLSFTMDKFICECGSKVQLKGKGKHLSTKKHAKWFASITPPVYTVAAQIVDPNQIDVAVAVDPTHVMCVAVVVELYQESDEMTKLKEQINKLTKENERLQSVILDQEDHITYLQKTVQTLSSFVTNFQKVVDSYFLKAEFRGVSIKTMCDRAVWGYQKLIQ
jgi:hypothetical protein